jgi:prepilin-type processing-associated H-X9-DG protein
MKSADEHAECGWSLKSMNSTSNPEPKCATPAVPRAGRGAFALIELLAVIAIITILAGMLLPGLARAKTSAQSIVCVNNLKQLQQCWHMYTLDYDDTMPPHIIVSDGSMQKGLPGSWVVGNAQTDTTTSNIMNGVLYPYIGSSAVYRCPADKSRVKGNAALTRTRSYSRDSWLNTDASRVGFSAEVLSPGMRIKSAQLHQPARIFTFIDEHEQGIDDGAFIASHPLVLEQPQNVNNWGSLPSDRHNQGCGVAFADGHAGIWHWKAPKPIAQAHNSAATANDLKDLRQMQTWIPLD